MIPRLLMGLGLLGSLAAPLGLAAWLGWDSARGVAVWVPVELADPDPETTELRPTLSELQGRHERHPWLALQVDASGTALAAERFDEPPPAAPDTVVVHAAGGLPQAHRRRDGSQPVYAVYRVSPGGVAYLVSLADADRAPVARGD